MKENKEIRFEVWNDAEWKDGDPVLSFNDIDKAITAISSATKVAPEEIKQFWNTRTINAIGISDWCIERVEK